MASGQRTPFCYTTYCSAQHPHLCVITTCTRRQRRHPATPTKLSSRKLLIHRVPKIPDHLLLTTREAAWFIISVDSVCLSVLIEVIEVLFPWKYLSLSVVSLGTDRPGWHTPGVLPVGKQFVGVLTKIVDKRGRPGKNVRGDTLLGVTPEWNQ